MARFKVEHVVFEFLTRNEALGKASAEFRPTRRYAFQIGHKLMKSLLNLHEQRIHLN